jgi:hypothetical protein
MTRQERLWLCVSALGPYLTDVLLTLAGQPGSYWAGQWQNVHEAYPVAGWLLRIHPLAFVGMALLWAGGFCCVLMIWQIRFAFGMAFVLALSHAVGASTWLVGSGWTAYLVPILTLILFQRVVWMCWRRAGVAGGHVNKMDLWYYPGKKDAR